MDCRNRRFVFPLGVKVSAVVLAVSAVSQVMAAENGLQRYSPGIGGSDMTSPLVPGWYVQLPMVAYHASKLKGGDGNTATSATPTPAKTIPGLGTIPAQPNLRSEIGIKADTYALLPRVTYLDNTQVLGANLGFTVMLPMVYRKAAFTASPIFAGSTVPSIAQSGYTASINSTLAGSQNGKEFGFGDLEFSPILHWEIGDHQAVTLAPTIVLPTGDYNVSRRVNPGYGNFLTFRPSVQYAFIGDGWDVGGRAVFSFNTRNKDNGYYSGNMFNLDWQLMKFVSDDVRVGLQGYVVRQLTKDTQDLNGYSAALAKEITNGNKTSVNAVGPAVGWLKNGGEMLLEGKLLKEFDARNRTEGQAFWLTVSKPL